MSKFEALCGMLPADTNWGDSITPQIVEQIVLAEREACANVARKYEPDERCSGVMYASDEIRMRSNAKG